jgi:cell shape-determining protein MreC
LIRASLIEQNNQKLKQALGPYAFKALEIQSHPAQVKRQTYSLTFIAAITRDKVLCTEVIEGKYDSTLFEDTIYKMLEHIRTDRKTSKKNVIVFMDNARIHWHS